ncbi:hypothetical protein ROA7023_04294 [Roseisalinus antarcticus]|uniref:Uncharacterized protein n=2 Tax=Roseisalinus antarcticus TaxID=254357 RepID=A0A1Y5U1W0_9RHOB|nr:hypothetical protein ROA7023_04294 [Roseisalinus antarcticus]
MRVISTTVLVLGLALPVVMPKAAAAQTYTLDEYLGFIVFDCALPGTEDFDVQDARDSAVENLGFEQIEIDDGTIRFINADGSRFSTTEYEGAAPSCRITIPQAVAALAEDEWYPYDILLGNFDRIHDDVEYYEGIAGGITYGMRAEWGYRISATLIELDTGDLQFFSTTLPPE